MKISQLVYWKWSDTALANTETMLGLELGLNSMQKIRL